eukprot:scaffold86567_cov27-Tisochrysis_lutea.AAC.1
MCPYVQRGLNKDAQRPPPMVSIQAPPSPGKAGASNQGSAGAGDGEAPTQRALQSVRALDRGHQGKKHACTNTHICTPVPSQRFNTSMRASRKSFRSGDENSESRTRRSSFVDGGRVFLSVDRCHVAERAPLSWNLLRAVPTAA